VKRNLTVLPILVVMTLALGAAAQDTVRIESQRGVDRRIPIAVPPFAALDPSLAAIAAEISEVIAFDLDFSGLFVVLPRTQYPPGFTVLDPDISKINMDAWRASRAEHLVFGVLSVEGDSLVGQFRLFDLFSKEQVVGQELRVQREHHRLAGHRFSEEIIRFLDGTPGIGTSEICFSAGTTGNKEIYVADYDGANARRVTNHNSISIKPKISPDGNKIAYLSYKDRYCFLYIYDRRTGQSVPLSKEVGLNSAPAWSPDGSMLAMTLSKDGNAEIYLRNPDGSNPRRLTRNKDGDTSPTFSPDGKRIAFVSDRGGTPQIFAMDVDGGNVTRLSYQGGSSFDPVWSPCGRYIAYVAQIRGEGFEIYVMNADGSNSRRLTTSPGISESPSWSPDSRHVIYSSTQTGSPQLWAVNLDSGLSRRIPRLNMLSEGPSWGPRRR
jgi:TolB protein